MSAGNIQYEIEKLMISPLSSVSGVCSDTVQ